MRALVNVMILLAATALSAGDLQAAPANDAARPNSASPVQLAQGGDFDGFRPACSYGFHYACWYEPYGSRYCGCWQGGDRPACPIGYHFDCRIAPNGYRSCACY